MAVAPTTLSPLAAAHASTVPHVDPRDPLGLIGQTVGHFQVEELLGAGGMGAVYRAYEAGLERHVALKVMGAGLGSNTELRERFLREARAQARLDHPNVVPIFHVGEEQGRCFFAMELVVGPSLEQVLVHQGPLVPEHARTWLMQIARALRRAQERGVIHRDIKPSNLLIGVDGTVKVADFGLAKAIGGGGPSLTGGGLVGTPLYMAPEQWQGEPVDHRTDIYALGASFYQLLGGVPPFIAKTPAMLVHAHCNAPLLPLAQRAPRLSPKLAAIIDRMLAKAPAERFQSYDELLRALEDPACLVAAASPPAAPFPAARRGAGSAVAPGSVVVGAAKGAAQPAAAATDASSAVASETRAEAGFWARFIAHLIDFAPFAIAVQAFDSVGLVPVCYGIYHILCWWYFGATLGKWLLRLRVRTIDGQRLTFRHAVLRFLLFGWFWIALFATSGVHWMLTRQNEIQKYTRPDGATDFGPSSLAQFFYGLILLGMIVELILVAIRRSPHDRFAGTRVVHLS